MKTRKILSLLLVAAMLCGLMLFSASATGGFDNPLNLSNMTLSIGDTTHPTWPESEMYFKLSSGTTYDAVHSLDQTTVETTYYPSLLSLYIVPASGVTINSITGTHVTFVTYAADGTPSTSTSCTVNSEGFYAICPEADDACIVITPNTGSAVTVNFDAPKSPTVPGGTKPKTVCGYLPVGQFARPISFGWGTIFTDNTNDYGTGNTPKFLSGYVSTGVSLGMLGGYVQFEFANAIGNNANNKYGVDFIVYGNPFNGNPEAGCVMVYGYNDAVKDYGWYTLAGSLHYITGTDGTTKCTNISYIRIDEANKTIGNSSFGAAGVYYSTDYTHPTTANQLTVDSAISSANWYAIPNSAAHVTNPVASQYVKSTGPSQDDPEDKRTVGISYWPERNTTENYHQVWKINGDTHVGGVFWDISETDSSVEVITYEGVTRVQDSDTTNYYRFGYADVRQNGSSYGTAINPYASLPDSATGGDGFDLSWAVDADGNPVTLTDVKFVRVYSAVLYNAGMVGETSTEVCGIYVTSGGGSNTISSDLKVFAGNTKYVDAKGNPQQPGSKTPNLSTKTIPYSSNMSIKLTSSDTYLYVNGEPVTRTSNEYYITSVSSGNVYQIITQSGTESPYIVLLKVS